MPVKISDSERARTEADISAAMQVAEKAFHVALKDPREWQKQLARMTSLLVKILSIVFLLAFLIGTLSDSTKLILPVGFTAAVFASLFASWPNVFRDRYDEALDQALAKLKETKKHET